MKTNSTYHIDLISRYFCGEASPEEIHDLEVWVKTDPANSALFSEYQKVWNAVEHARIGSSIDLNREWKKLTSSLKIRSENLESEIVNPKSKIRDLKSEVVNRKSRFLAWSLRVAAIFILLAVPAFLLYRYITLPGDKQLVAGSEVIEQTLPDGTTVTLNAGATLSYPSRFEGSSRIVSLQGEAWFEVSHDKTKPFIIAAGNARIRVMGTSFFVNTKTWDDTREIILSEGVVKVYYENNPEIMAFLFPGDKAEMTCDGYAISKTTNSDVNFLAWKTKHMVFNNTPLNEVAAMLTKVYHTNIRLSGDRLSDCRITTTFDKQSLESVLNVLKATLDLQVTDTGAGIELSGH
ncbi:MAG: FecR domain-containing protein [Bacteroidales bacterium]|nr:FecR domain-containing protein [Bacteroidales bacterium]